VIAPKLAVFAMLFSTLVTIGGCSLPERGVPVPQADTARALPLGIPNARFFSSPTVTPSP
jgi:hypothetical protein